MTEIRHVCMPVDVTGNRYILIPMNKRTVDGVEVTVYGESDLGWLEGAAENARALWSKRAEAYLKKHGDVGSCVLGAGFWVWFQPKGKRKPVKRMILSAEEVTSAQGSLVWEDSKDEVMKCLTDGYVEGVEYAWGRMD
jgi:hypothetical protein